MQLIGGALASIAAVGAIAGGLVGYWTVWKTLRTDVFPDKQQTQREATARPDIAPRLSLVVLPFANVNNDPEQDYFADGITTDLTTDLARMPGAFVIGRGTAFTYKNKQIDFRTLGKDLGIRWAVQGAVRRSGDQVRVNVSLTDIASGRDVWSDRFDGDRTNLAALQDQITARLARSLNIELIQAESRRSEVDRSRNPDATDFTMRGWAKLYEPQSKIQNGQAMDLFDSALRLDPDNVEAMIGKARCLAAGVNNRWSASVVEDKGTRSTSSTEFCPKARQARVLIRPRETFFYLDTLRGHRLNTMLRSKLIQIIQLPTVVKQSHLSSPGGRAKPSPRPSWLSVSVPEILLLSNGASGSAMHTCTCTNMEKPSRNAGARSI